MHHHGRVHDLPAAELQRNANCRVGHLDLVFRAIDHSRIGQKRDAEKIWFLSCRGSQQGGHDAAAGSARDFTSAYLPAVAKKTQVVKWLMDREDWDLFLVVFGESHPAGHYFWHYHDPSYIAHSKEQPGQSALRDVYIALDKAIGDILQGVDDATTVFLVSGDGMGPNYSGSHILNDLLTRMKLFNNIPTSANGSAGKDDGAGNAE